MKNNNVFENMDVKSRCMHLSGMESEAVFEALNSSSDGMAPDAITASKEQFGSNVIETGKRQSLIKKIVSAFVNPFTAILIALAVVSLFTDVILEKDQKDPTTVIIIVTMVLISGILRYIQEERSNQAAQKLSELVETTTLVKRQGEQKTEVSIDDVVVGDVIYLSAGDMIPADMRILEAKDLFMTQAALTGESEHVEKFGAATHALKGNLAEQSNLAFMGSDVISGSAMGIVIAVGSDTLFGAISKQVTQTETETNFEAGVNSVSWLLIRFMLVMVPIVFFINGFTKGDWMGALLFAVSVAVGLTPEMLPMIVTTSLAKVLSQCLKRRPL